MIAVGRSHEPPEVVVSVCTALVLNMLYTSKNPMTRTALTRSVPGAHVDERDVQVSGWPRSVPL